MRWVDANSSNKIEHLETNSHIVFEGVNGKEIFFLIHGFGSSYRDLLSIADELKQRNFTVVILTLAGHRGIYEPTQMKLSYWLNEFESIVLNESQGYESIYFIGFSVGALTSILLAHNLKNNLNIAGVMAISTFLGLKSNGKEKMILHTAKYLGISALPRILQVKSKELKSSISYWNSLPVDVVINLDLDIKEYLSGLDFSDVKILFLHSIDDTVAKYDLLLDLVNNVSNMELISFKGLKHFMHYDIPSEVQFNILSNHFDLEK